MYAENGRGKTTIAAVLRSLATDDPIPITERHRLAAQNPPHVVLDCDGGPSPAMFQNGTWNRTLQNMVMIYDDVFVDENVYSGLVVGPDHRQNLHELILGAQGIALNGKVQRLVARIEEHNTELRAKAAVIPAADRGALSVDEFCSLQPLQNIDEEIQATERSLEAVRQQDPIRTTSAFGSVNLPMIDVSAIENVLKMDLPSLDETAAARVQAHLASAFKGAEAWVAEGIRHFPAESDGEPSGTCPFCAQKLAGSQVISHYRAYFSDAYRELKRVVGEVQTSFARKHGGESFAAFERSLKAIGELKQFWSHFCDAPDTNIDTVAIELDLQTAREVVFNVLRKKQSAPLERMEFSQADRASIASYNRHLQAVEALNHRIQEANAAIRIVKEQAATGNPAALSAKVSRLKAIKARHIPATAALCEAYLVEKAAKAGTEQERDQAKIALDGYRANAFPGYQTTINQYLGRFNAGFRLDQVVATNTRGGPACTYNVVINNTSIPIASSETIRGRPSFRNTLSAGDRNTLALAFFFASLDQDPALNSKIVVIDDPVSSMDEHRINTTVQEIRRLSQRASQVIVLSHNKRLLCGIWKDADRTSRAALQVSRDATGSTIVEWNVDQNSETEHDRRHALLREYLATAAPNAREVASFIRPTLEAFLRVACPEHFPPGTLLGPFRGICEQRVGTSQQILTTELIHELNDLIEYANKFHHDTNPAWDTEEINDGELKGYVERAVKFAKR